MVIFGLSDPAGGAPGGNGFGGRIGATFDPKSCGRVPPIPMFNRTGSGGGLFNVVTTGTGGVVGSTTNGLMICSRLGIGRCQIDQFRKNQSGGPEIIARGEVLTGDWHQHDFKPSRISRRRFPCEHRLN